jgi:hypothetical protein
MVRELRTEEFGKQEVVRMGLFICLGLLFSWDPSLVYISQRLCRVPRTELLAMPITYRLVIISDKEQLMSRVGPSGVRMIECLWIEVVGLRLSRR